MAPEVFTFDPSADWPSAPGAPRVLWLAPGSLSASRLTAAWESRGELADLASITGPWAAVLWNPRTNSYFVATDPLGVQPVFWTRGTNERIYVASWLDRLLDEDHVSVNLDYEAVLLDTGDSLMVDRQAHRTRFVGVSRVLWGRAVEFAGRSAPRTVRYWDRSHLPEADESLSPADSAQLLRECLDQAIARSVATEDTYGAHISGGLDCSAVAVRAHQRLAERGGGLRRGYSWAPPEDKAPLTGGDERRLLDAISAATGIDIQRTFDDGRGDWFWYRDINRYPQSTHTMERLTLPSARADGVTVMLSGWGGDECASFNGRRVVNSLLRRGQLATAWRVARDRADVTTVGRGNPHLSAMAVLLRATHARTFDALRHPKQHLAQRRASVRIDELLRSQWPTVAAARLEAREQFDSVRNYRDLQWYLLTDGHLQHRTAWWYQTGRLFNVQYRFPLLDLDVVRAAFHVPWRAYLNDGWSRYSFRLAVQQWLPKEVAWNATKDEPALFTLTLPPANRPSGLPPQAGSDPRLAEVLLLSDRTYPRTWGASGTEAADRSP